jgi:hypothetical protein
VAEAVEEKRGLRREVLAVRNCYSPKSVGLLPVRHSWLMLIRLFHLVSFDHRILC